MVLLGNNYFVIEAGSSSNAQMQILNDLHQQRPGLEKVHKVEQCDVILVFCPIVSRAGTDIEAAMNELNTCSESKPAIFMVLHHTFDTNKTIPGSSRFIKRRNTLTVDYLFHEDMGLLKCDINDKALATIAKYFEPQDVMGGMLRFVKKIKPRFWIMGCSVCILVFYIYKSVFLTEHKR